MAHPGRGRVLSAVAAALVLLHSGGAAAQVVRNEASASRGSAASGVRDEAACPDGVCETEVENGELSYRLPCGLSDGERIAVNHAVWALLSDVGEASFSFACEGPGGDGARICTAAVREGTTGAGDAEGGGDPVHLAVDPGVVATDARAVRVRFRDPAGDSWPTPDVAPGVLDNACIPVGGHRRYDAVPGSAGWAAGRDAGGEVVVGGGGVVKAVGKLPPMGESRLVEVLRFLADRRERFCAEARDGALWLAFDASGDCARPALRTWRIWHAGRQLRDGARTPPGTLRLRTKLTAQDVDVDAVLELVEKLGVEHADPDVMLTRHRGAILPLTADDEAFLEYRVAPPPREGATQGAFRLRVAVPESERGTFLPVAEDDDEDMLHAVIAASAGAGFEIGALDVRDVNPDGGAAIFGVAPGESEVSAIHVWSPAGQSAGARLTRVALEEGTRPRRRRESDIAVALRDIVTPGGEMRLGGRGRTLRLCSAAHKPWRRVAYGGAGQMNVPVWAGGGDVACADHRERDWEPAFEAVAAIAEDLEGDELYVALAPAGGGHDLVAVPLDPGAAAEPRHALWRTAPAVAETGCETRLRGKPSAALIRHLSEHELECRQTEEIERASDAPSEGGSASWATGLRTRVGTMVLLAEDCPDLTLDPLPGEGGAQVDGADLERQFRAFVARPPAPACDASDGRWLVASRRLFVVVGGRVSAADDTAVAAELAPEVVGPFVRRAARWLATRPDPPPGLRAALLGGEYVMLDVGSANLGQPPPRYDDVGFLLGETRCAGRVARKADSMPPVFDREPDRDEPPQEGAEDGYRCERIVVSLKLSGKRWEPDVDDAGRMVSGLRNVAVTRHVVVTPSAESRVVDCLRELARAEVEEACSAAVRFENGGREPLSGLDGGRTGRALLAGVLPGEPGPFVDLVAAVSGPGWRLVTHSEERFLLEDSEARRLRFNYLNGTCVEVDVGEVDEVVKQVLRGGSPSRTGRDRIQDIEKWRRESIENSRGSGVHDWWTARFTQDPLMGIGSRGRSCADPAVSR